MTGLLLFLLVAAAQTPAVTPARDRAVASGSGSISGSVVDRESTDPVPGALVTLQPASGQSQTAIADAKGQYVFSSLPPGEYAVVAGPAELRATHLRQAFGRDEPLTVYSPLPSPSIALGPGERLDAVNFSLVRGLAIEGRILGTDGEPLTEVSVEVRRPDGTLYPSEGSSSDDRGAYRVYRLPPGRYRVCATPGGGGDEPQTDSRLVRTCHPSAFSPSDAADVILTTSDAPAVDIQVLRQGTLTISGSVIDAAGATIDAPKVSAVAADRTPHSYVSTVGKDGRFALRGVLPGKHWLQASFGGPLTPADVRPPARELEVGYASVDVGSGDVSDVAIQLSAARSVRGRIVFEGTRPVPAGELHMTVHSGMPLQLGMLSPHSQPVSEVGDNLGFTLNGFYQLPMIIGMRGLPEGWVIKTIRWGELDITGVATNFGGGSGSDQLEIRLTNRVARPSVRVTDEKGSPVASYSVAIFPTDPARWTSPAAPADSPPSQQGVLALGAIVPGEYFVAALEPEVFRSVMIGEMALADVATVATRVSLREGDSTVLDIKLTRLSGAAK